MHLVAMFVWDKKKILKIPFKKIVNTSIEKKDSKEKWTQKLKYWAEWL